MKARDVGGMAVNVAGKVLWAGLYATAVVVDLACDVAKAAAGIPGEMRKERDRRFDDMSLTCNGCGSLAAPVSGSTNRYRCPCGRQFKGARHNL